MAARGHVVAGPRGHASPLGRSAGPRRKKKMIAGPTATPRGREGDPKTAGLIDTQRPRGVVCYTQLWPTGLLSGTGIVGAAVDVECHLVMGPCRSRGPT